MTADALTGRSLAAGRVLAGVRQRDFAIAARIAVDQLRRWEQSGSEWIPADDARRLSRALNEFGVIIFAESNGMGAGVRLKFTRLDVRQICRLENEGGIALADNVP